MSIDKNLKSEYFDKGYIIVDLYEYMDTINGVLDFEINHPDIRINGFKQSEAVLELGFNIKILDILRFLYDLEPFPFQTLNFPNSPQQGMHSDQIHFSSIPYGYMAGVWVALEDVEMDMGPLYVVPHSHHLDFINMRDLNLPLTRNREEWTSQLRLYSDYLENKLTNTELQKKPFLAKKGQALIWGSNVLHGSHKKLDKKTRFSQVTHYFFKNMKYCTPGQSDFETGNVLYRQPFEMLHQFQNRIII